MAPAEGEAVQAEGEAATEPFPEVAPGRLASIIESLFFASDHPLTLAELKRLVGERDGSKVTGVDISGKTSLRGSSRPPAELRKSSRPMSCWLRSAAFPIRKGLA